MDGWTFLTAPPAQTRNEFREQAESVWKNNEREWSEVRPVLMSIIEQFPELRVPLVEHLKRYGDGT